MTDTTPSQIDVAKRAEPRAAFDRHVGADAAQFNRPMHLRLLYRTSHAFGRLTCAVCGPAATWRNDKDGSET